MPNNQPTTKELKNLKKLLNQHNPNRPASAYLNWSRI